MPDPIVTLQDMDKLLEERRREDGWDLEAYARGDYVYIQKRAVAKLHELMTRATQECQFLMAQLGKEATLQKRTEFQHEQITELTDLLGSRENQIKELTMELADAQDMKAQPPIQVLKKLRKVLEGCVMTPKEHAAILAEADEQLKLHGVEP